MGRKVRLTGFSRLARSNVHVSVDRSTGLVQFRVHHKHTSYELSLDNWIGLGFDHAVKAHAYAVRQARKEARKARKDGVLL